MQATYDEHADLYDVAFDWDVSGEVEWIVARLGVEAPATLVEPACGSGRMVPDFLRRGFDVVGIDRSETMIARAAARVAWPGAGSQRDASEANLGSDGTARFVVGDIRDFSLPDAPFDGAYCPINSLGYLRTDDDMRTHLQCVADALRIGARYLVQLDLHTLYGYVPDVDGGCWTERRYGRMVRARWRGLTFDPETRLEVQRSTFEVLEGPDAGRTVEEDHVVRLWDWASWSAMVEASRFQLRSAWDGDADTRPRLELGPGLERHRLTWHVLERC